MPRKIPSFCFSILALVCVFPAFAQMKPAGTALVIGNGSYRNLRNSASPARDAADLAKALSELGFEVISGTDQDKQQTEKLIEEFRKKLEANRGVGFFYYAGIGFNLNGENFLVPVDADFAGEKETAATSVSIDSILSKLRAAQNDSNVIVLDPKYGSPNRSLWNGRLAERDKIGFSRISAPAGSSVFYASGIGRVAGESCGRNGLFARSFLKQLETPKIKFNQLFRNIYDELEKRADGYEKPFIDGVLPKDFYLVTEGKRFKMIPDTLEEFFNSYKSERRCPCGERDEALFFGKEIIEKFGNDTENRLVIDYVRKDIAKIEKEDRDCRLGYRYNNAYQGNDWEEFFAVSRQLIAKEGNSPLALDLMLTHVAVGYHRAALDKIDTYNVETVYFAKEAIKRIEAGDKSLDGSWGIFMPFKTTRFSDGRSNALSWMNYIIGWIYFNRLGVNDPGKKKEGLNYFYKSTLIGSEMVNDYRIYVSFGEYYFEQATILDEEYRQILTANNNVENAEANLKRALALGHLDRAVDAFGRAYNIARQNPEPRAAGAIKKRLDELYRRRFVIPNDENPKGVDEYLKNLTGKPMPDPVTKVEPILK